MNKYKMIIYTMNDGDSVDYVAEYPSLKGVVGVGSNEFEAITNLIESAEVNIAALAEAGLPIPEDDSLVRNEYSGKLSVRLSSSLHRKISELSERENVSINQCIVEAISMYVANQILGNKICEKLDEALNQTFNLGLKLGYPQEVPSTLSFRKNKSSEYKKNPIKEIQYA